MAMTPDDATLRSEMMRLARARGPDKSFCPSEVARSLAENWRPLMPRIRALATGLPLAATQKGRPVDPAEAKGPIRLSLGKDA